MKTGSVAREVFLSVLDQLGEVTESLLTPPGRRNTSSQYWVSDDEWKRFTADARRRRCLETMRRKRWIHERREGSRVLYCFEQDFLVHALKEYIRTNKQPLPDGEVCLVLFDFPNGSGKIRNSWRHFLHVSGFKRRQLSVWQTNMDVIKECKALIRLLKIERWVEVLRVIE